jgi:hypothetical protein
MLLVKLFDDLTNWVLSDICSKITLKLPDDNQNGKNYEPQFVHPTAFALYLPGKEKLPPSVPAQIPSICVQLMEGNDMLTTGKRKLKMRLNLACWNPGTHGAETYHPRKNQQALGGYSYYRVDNPDAADRYKRNNEGWRDIWNFADLTLRELEGTEYIVGWRIAKEDGISYGPFTEDGAIWDYYPYWHSWIAFTLEAGVPNKIPEAYKDYL